MKGRSIKNKLMAMFLMGALFAVFIASMGVYGTLKGGELTKRFYDKNAAIVNLISHLREEIRNTRVELVTMTIEREHDEVIRHKTNMELLDEDITADFDEFIKGGYLREQEGVLSKLIKAQSVWKEFLETRYGEIIPLMLEENYEKAMSHAREIQQERYHKIMTLLDETTSDMDAYLHQKKKETDLKSRRFVAGIAIIMALGLAAGMIVFYSYSVDIVARVGALKEGAKRISGGDLSFRVALSGEDEIADLGVAFNSMADWVQEDMDTILRDQRELQENNAKLEEAMMEARQHSKVIEFASKERERQNKMLVDMQAQLLNSEKMASVGQLAAGVAHEINNPVGFINGNMSTLSAYVEDIRVLNLRYEELVAACREENCEKVRDLEVEIGRFREDKDMEFVFEDLTKLVSESRQGLERVTSIVRDLKSFSHIGEAEAKEFDINKGLDSTINIAWNEIKYKAEVKKDYGNIPTVYCYPQQLNQVFMNIIVNAAHALEDKNTFGVRSSEFGVLPAPNSRRPTPNDRVDNGRGLIKIKTYHDSNSVFVEISDNGCGIPEEKIGNIFDPFFTTKPVGNGTGLGLSLAYNIVKKHNGEIGVKSKAGEGTTFTIRVPVDANNEELQDAGYKMQVKALT